MKPKDAQGDTTTSAAPPPHWDLRLFQESALLCTCPHWRGGGCSLPRHSSEKPFFIIAAPAASPDRLDQVTDPFVFPAQSTVVCQLLPLLLQPRGAGPRVHLRVAQAQYFSLRNTENVTASLMSIPCTRLHQFPGPWEQFPASTPFQLSMLPRGARSFLNLLKPSRCW